jgi:hypothetical protein
MIIDMSPNARPQTLLRRRDSKSREKKTKTNKQNLWN